VDVRTKVDELVTMVEDARTLPMSSSCVLNRAELLSVVEEIRGLLPEQIDEASRLVEERDTMLSEAREESKRILAEAHEQRSRLLSEAPRVQEAHEEALRITARARDEADAVRAEVDDYVDAKLANFEVVLSRTSDAVQRGRERLHARGEQADQADDHDSGSGMPGGDTLGEPDGAAPSPPGREGPGTDAHADAREDARTEPPGDTRAGSRRESPTDAHADED